MTIITIVKMNIMFLRGKPIPNSRAYAYRRIILCELTFSPEKELAIPSPFVWKCHLSTFS